MRGARWLSLLAIFAILGWLLSAYKTQRRSLEANAPHRPDLLPVDLSGQALDWYSVKTDEKGRKLSEIWARNFKQEKESSKMELEGVRLHLFTKEGDAYNNVESPFATFQPSEDKLYTDGEVMITLKVPVEGEPTHRLVSIHTSGVSFDTKTGKASTDRQADFVFENGTGSSLGATYDPNTKELLMNSRVVLHLNGKGPNGKPMKLESEHLIYREEKSQIQLYPWARLTRDTSVTEGGDTLVTLKDKAIQLVETQNAKGVDMDPKRHVEYSADHLVVHYNDTGDVDYVSGEPNARLLSTTEFSRTTITSDRVDMGFADKDHQTTLSTVNTKGHGYIESKPIAAAPGEQMPDTRVLRSEVIEMKMRPGGREIETIVTRSPGFLEFTPNHPGPRRRLMEGEQLIIQYGQRNMVQSFRSTNVHTRSEPVKQSDPPSQTWSKDLQAEFDPKTGQLSKMHQWNDFHYEEGARKAVAKDAQLDQDSSKMTLTSAARVWDASGSTSADVIHMDQNAGSFTADGHVSTSRLPDKEKKQASSDLLSGDEPIQATAQRMISNNHNSYIRYDGKAYMWQGANRIRAERIEIDREAQRLVAYGGVETELKQKPKEEAASQDGPGKAPPAPIFTVVKSTGLIYTDSDRLAYYTGGVVLKRPNMQVKSIELRSYLSVAGSDNSLERSYADGKVEVQQITPQRTRTGTSEHAEYYVADDKIVLRGGAPALVDSVKGNTHGAELTYFAGDDRLIVNGSSAQQPANSRLRKKHSQ